MRRPSPLARIAVAIGVLAVVALAYNYIATHQIDRTIKRFVAGKPVAWPPDPKPDSARSSGFADDPADTLIDTVLGPLRVLALLALLIICGVGISRLLARRRRITQTRRWELQLGRDDLSNPYRVQKALEGIAGGLSARWYRRVFFGQDHFALETHRLADESVRFSVCATDLTIGAIRGSLEDLYPDVRLAAVCGKPSGVRHVVRLKKRRSFVLSLQTTKNYEHALSEAIVSALGTAQHPLSVQLVLCPTPLMLHRRARRLLKARERGLNAIDRDNPVDPGMDSRVEAAELEGAMETQHRSLLYFDLRVTGEDADEVRRVAGLFAQLRSENELSPREMHIRRRLYSDRARLAAPNPVPSLHTGLLSTSEIPSLWQLPRARSKHARIPRQTARRAAAPPEVQRNADRTLLEDERGPVSLAAGDRRYGHALIGGQGMGKSAVMARHLYTDARDTDRAVILLDPKGPLAELAVGLVPANRTVHYIDLGAPELGINPLRIDASAGTRSDVFVKSLIEANPPGSIQAASDSFLRQAVFAVCSVEEEPTLWHVYRLLQFGDSDYRESVVQRLEHVPGTDFARNYWRREFPALIGDKGFAAQALNPPRNKLERLISTREIDLVLRHPLTVDIEGIIERGEVLIVGGAKSAVGEDNSILVMQLLLQLIHRAIQHQQQADQVRQVSLLVDEAHNILTTSTAKMLAEGRSAGLEAVFAWQYTAQIADEIVRSGVRSLLQSISIFRMREIDEARSQAGLAMQVYADRISIEHEEQERLRFSADDILSLPRHHAINLWVAEGIPRAAFIAQTLRMEDLHDPDVDDHHRQAQRHRGGHHPEHLPAPTDLDRAGSDDPPAAEPDSTPAPGSAAKPEPVAPARDGKHGKPTKGKDRKGADRNEHANALQLGGEGGL